MIKGSRGSVLLIELLIVILFFSISAGIDLRLFAQAHDRQVESRKLSRAVVECQDWAETVYASQDPLEALKSGGWIEQNDKSYSLIADGIELIANLSWEKTAAGTLTTGKIEAVNGGEVIFSLPVSRYRPGGDEG